MDHIYPVKDFKKYNIKESVQKLQENVKSDTMPNSFHDISRVLNITEENLKTKSLELCSLYEDYGSVPANEEEEPYNVFSPECLELNCMKYIRKGQIHFKDKRVKEKPCVRLNIKEKEKDIEPYKESIVTVRFYEPFKYDPTVKNHPRFHQEFKVLGSNFLTDLRDKIYCQCNFGPFFDLSDNPTSTIDPNENRPDPGFFYIHDKFYNDTRNEKNADYSEVIISNFRKMSGVGSFSKGVMQDTKFEDLTLRIGYPCLYQHHGACEHIFCIVSIDLIDNSDSLVRSDYPILSFSSYRKNTLCEICGQTDATFLINNCALHIKDPTRMCETCFFSFHYIDKDTKTCAFSAYRVCNTNPSTAAREEQICEAENE